MAWKEEVIETDISSQISPALPHSLTFPQGSIGVEKEFNLHSAERVINTCQQPTIEGHNRNNKGSNKGLLPK